MIKAIIFDWFGVLTEKWVDVWEREVPEVDSKMFRESFFRYLDQYADNSITGQDFLKSVFKEVDLEPTGYDYLLKKQGDLNNELLELIMKLRGKYKTAILSDNFNEIVPVIEKEIGGFQKYFDVVILSNKLSIGKIDEKIYTLTLDKLKVKPEDSIFIDDKEKNLSVARELGIKTILYKNNEQLKEDLISYGVVIS